MTKKLLLFLTFIPFTYILPMHQALVNTDWHCLPLELKCETASHLRTLKDLASFSQTCKEHAKDISVNALLFNTNIPHFLSCNDHTQVLIYHTKENFPFDESNLTIDTKSENYKKIAFLIDNENEKQRFNRLEALNFFGYKDSSVINTIKSYQAIPIEESNFRELGLYDALVKKNFQILKIILENKPNLMSNSPLKQSILILAIFLPCKKKSFSLLLNHTKHIIDLQDIMGETALHHACRAENYDLAKLLINHNCNVNLENMDLKTPLHIAIDHKEIKIAKLLVANGADINITTPQSKKRAINTLSKKNQNALRECLPNNLKRKKSYSTEQASKKRRK